MEGRPERPPSCALWEASRSLLPRDTVPRAGDDIVLAWRGPDKITGGSGQTVWAAIRVGTACSQRLGGRPTGLRGLAERLGARRCLPAGAYEKDGLFQALASLHAALPRCPVWATDSLIFFFHYDSFENLISKGNCLNTNHDCEA